MMVDKREKTFSRKHVKWAKEHELLIYRLLTEERNRIQVDRMQRKHFGSWSDIFSSIDRCSGRALLCLLGKTVIGYQAFESGASKGNPFPPELSVMRLTFIVVREDSRVKARHLGVATELLRRTLDIAWKKGFDAVYTYATAYELMIKGGLHSQTGEETLEEAKYARDFDPDQATPLLFVAERPGNYVRPF
jgi:hypothetical protein